MTRSAFQRPTARLALVVLVVVVTLAPTSTRTASAVPGWITTVAGTGDNELGKMSGRWNKVNIGQPFGVEVAPDESLLITEIESHRVLRLDPKTGKVSTIAGNGTKGYSGDGGPAVEATLNEPYEVRLDTAGNIYFVEMVGAVIRRVAADSGTIFTIAGTGEAGFAGDGGPAIRARLRQPHSIALDGRGGLYVADIGNHRIRRVDLGTGIIETIAGTGAKRLPLDGSVATGKPMLGPRALYIADNVLWIALREGHSVWKMDIDTRRLEKVAGTGQRGYRDGMSHTAQFNGPKGIVAGPARSGSRRDIFVVDTENQAIRRIDLEQKMVETVAGVAPAGRGYAGEGGPALEAMLDRPHGIAVDSRGTLYIGDTNNHRVRRVTFR